MFGAHAPNYRNQLFPFLLSNSNHTFIKKSEKFVQKQNSFIEPGNNNKKTACVMAIVDVCMCV